VKWLNAPIPAVYRRARLRYLAILHYLGRNKLALATIVLALFGWLALTHGLVQALDVSWLWFVSLGLLALGLAGFRLIGRVLRDGLYVLTRDDKDTKKE